MFRDRLGTGAEQLDKPRPGPWPMLSTLNVGFLLMAEVHTPSRDSLSGTQSGPWDTREACVDVLNVTNGGSWSALLIPPDSVSSSIQWGQPEHLTGWVWDQMGSHLSSTVSEAQGFSDWGVMTVSGGSSSSPTRAAYCFLNPRIKVVNNDPRPLPSRPCKNQQTQLSQLPSLSSQWALQKALPPKPVL